MINHINIIHNFFINYSNNLISKKILKKINEKSISLDYLSKSKKGHVASNFLLIAERKILDPEFKLRDDLEDKIKEIEIIQSMEISKNGFINIYIKKQYLIQSLYEIVQQGNKFGNINYANNKKINIEFVSANPTGPIHIAHIRGAVIGDVLSNMFKKIGYAITKEYYVNDAGSQIEILGTSLYKRYCQLLNVPAEIEENEYPGEYLIEIAKKIISDHGDKWINESNDKRINFFKKFAVESLMTLIKNNLSLIDVEFDKFTYESDIVSNKLINQLFDILNKKQLIYEGTLDKPKGLEDPDWEPRKQLLFKSSSIYDDTDRPLKNSKNEWTYFANDSAYHFDKHLRKYDKLINVWGADHIGYIPRMKSILFSLSENKDYFEVITCQIVRLIKNNKILKMSKREGNFVTLEEVYKSVGTDALRYFMISTRSETSMDFDMDRVIEKNKDNPVFYCQYAYARASSIINKAKDLNFFNLDSEVNENIIESISDEEWEIILKLISFPYLLLHSCLNREPHRITNYLEDISTSFHSFWNKGKDDDSLRFLNEDNIDKMKIRLFWVESLRIVFKNSFDLIGIQSPESM